MALEAAHGVEKGKARRMETREFLLHTSQMMMHVSENSLFCLLGQMSPQIYMLSQLFLFDLIAFLQLAPF